MRTSIRWVLGGGAVVAAAACGGSGDGGGGPNGGGAGMTAKINGASFDADQVQITPGSAQIPGTMVVTNGSFAVRIDASP